MGGGTRGMMLKRSAEEEVGESWQLGPLDRGQTNSDVRGWGWNTWQYTGQEGWGRHRREVLWLFHHLCHEKNGRQRDDIGLKYGWSLGLCWAGQTGRFLNGDNAVYTLPYSYNYIYMYLLYTLEWEFGFRENC